jgi:diadenosine tetraphosphate (Ap4A) HIT family hydrolase
MSFVLHPQLANDTFLMTDLPLCRVLLMNESRYPWLILVPRRPDIREIYELTPPDRQQFWQESDQVSRALVAICQPDKLNIAALGNVVPQLHIHHIARFTQDEAWPAPVWGRFSPKPYTEQAAQDLIQSILKSLL